MTMVRGDIPPNALNPLQPQSRFWIVNWRQKFYTKMQVAQMCFYSTSLVEGKSEKSYDGIIYFIFYVNGIYLDVPIDGRLFAF